MVVDTRNQADLTNSALVAENKQAVQPYGVRA